MANILLIDDDQDILKFSEVILKSQGHEIFTATHADQAMDHIRSQQIELVYCDINMPHVSGFDVLNHIRSQPKYRKLPIALLTGRREKKDVEKAIKLGVSDYIVKPINPELLIEKTRMLLNKEPPSTNRFTFGENFVPHAEATLDLKLRTITDNDVVLESETPIVTDVTFWFSTTIFTQMGIEKVRLVVTDVDVEESKYIIRANYKDISDQELKKIAAWIRARNRENKAKGAA